MENNFKEKQTNKKTEDEEGQKNNNLEDKGNGTEGILNKNDENRISLVDFKDQIVEPKNENDNDSANSEEIIIQRRQTKIFQRIADLEGVVRSNVGTLYSIQLKAPLHISQMEMIQPVIEDAKSVSSSKSMSIKESIRDDKKMTSQLLSFSSECRRIGYVGPPAIFDKLPPSPPVMKSIVKIEEEHRQRKKLEMLKRRAALPVMTRDDIINHRLPFHLALIRKLEKAGFENSAAYLGQLYEFEEVHHVKLEEGDPEKPFLKDERFILKKLRDGLVRAELANRENDTATEIDELLKLAIEYSFGSQDWWWLGHQLMQQCVSVSATYDEDKQKRKALCRYFFGKFLVEKDVSLEEGIGYLDTAREITFGVPWTPAYFLPTGKKTIHFEACCLLAKVFLLKAKRSIKTNVHEALKLAREARIRATEACYHDGESEAYILIGNCQSILHDTASAIRFYQKGLRVQENYENPDLLCELMVRLSATYLKHGVLHKALETLYQLKEYAELYEKEIYVAHAYKSLGEFYLREGSPASSTPFLISALKLFHAQGSIVESEIVRNLAAISVGIDMMPLYAELIINSDKTRPNYLMNTRKLLAWKDSKEEFWDPASNIAIAGRQSMMRSDDPEYLLDIESINSKQSLNT